MVERIWRNVGSGCLVISGSIMESGMQSFKDSNFRCDVPSCNRFASRGHRVVVCCFWIVPVCVP
jgi:hypothetical protein